MGGRYDRAVSSAMKRQLFFCAVLLRGPCTCVFAREELPGGDFAFEVRPVAENGREGAPLRICAT